MPLIFSGSQDRGLIWYPINDPPAQSLRDWS
jgi:hypothetical protein